MYNGGEGGCMRDKRVASVREHGSTLKHNSADPRTVDSNRRESLVGSPRYSVSSAAKIESSDVISPKTEFKISAVPGRGPLLVTCPAVSQYLYCLYF